MKIHNFSPADNQIASSFTMSENNNGINNNYLPSTATTAALILPGSNLEFEQ
jgi:hypothetical protein